MKKLKTEGEIMKKTLGVAKWWLAALILMVNMVGIPVLAGPGVCETGDKAGQWVDEVAGCTDEKKSVDKVVPNIINFLIGIVGILAIIMIIWSGMRYVLSAGDAGKIKTARTTLLYGVVGLVIALLAFAIVNFVIGILFK